MFPPVCNFAGHLNNVESLACKLTQILFQNTSCTAWLPHGPKVSLAACTDTTSALSLCTVMRAPADNVRWLCAGKLQGGGDTYIPAALLLRQPLLVH